MIDYKKFILDVKDYPKPGILFKDLSPLWTDPEVFNQMIKDLCKPWKNENFLDGTPIDLIASIESRGFIMGSAMAHHLGCGFVPLRKPNKLPRETYSESFDLEYGSTEIHIHKDAITDQNILIADDLLATGGTAIAAYNLLKRFPNATIMGFSFIVSLNFLRGSWILKQSGLPVETLVEYE